MTKKAYEFYEKVDVVYLENTQLQEKKYKAPYGTWWSSHPFCNCQNFTIGNFVGLLQAAESEQLSFEDISSLIASLTEEEGVCMLMIDVYDSYDKKIKQIFKGYKFVIDSKYQSTNGTNMHIYFIEIFEGDYYNDDEDDDDDDD